MPAAAVHRQAGFLRTCRVQVLTALLRAAMLAALRGHRLRPPSSRHSICSFGAVYSCRSDTVRARFALGMFERVSAWQGCSRSLAGTPCGLDAQPGSRLPLGTQAGLLSVATAWQLRPHLFTSPRLCFDVDDIDRCAASGGVSLRLAGLAQPLILLGCVFSSVEPQLKSVCSEQSGYLLIALSATLFTTLCARSNSTPRPPRAALQV